MIFAQRIFLAVTLLSSLASTRGAELPPDFQRDVLPVLYHHCFSCHSEKQAKPKGGLRLDSVQGFRKSDVVAPGKPDESELLRRACLPIGDKETMPPIKGGAQPLSEPERDVLRRWIAAGASFGDWVKFDHRGPALAHQPQPTNPAALSPKIDALIEKLHAARGTQINAPANDETFVRRVYLDAIGRIPSLEESGRFLANTAPDKRSRLIDELLASPGFTSHFFNWKADQLRLLALGLPGQPGFLYDAWVKEAVRSQMPYDDFVRKLITADGYLWENGAVGFYVRDLGMPLDHMSNLTRVFLGTRIECAQCHDHPLQPTTQKDFYQMVAFTFGVTNLNSSAGYSENNVKQWPELKAKLDAISADSALRQGVSRTISALKRLTTDSGKALTFPETYVYDAKLRKQPVAPRTLFGDEAPVENGKPREAFAAWLTSPRNPRFATNIANRLWKRVMGAGLIEPVDSLSVLPLGENAELLALLTQAIIDLRFDERAFTAALLKTRLYQSEAVRDTPAPSAACDLRGPLLRRLSAEQIWDSCLTLLMPEPDERTSRRNVTGSMFDPEHLRQLTRMSADDLLTRARDEIEYRKRQREYQLRLAEQSKERAAAKAAGDEAKVRALQSAHTRENAEFFSPKLKALHMEGPQYDKETDPRWKHLPTALVRASEIPLPLPLGHFLRQFGQSDRREIDAFNRDPNTTHALALMNGELTGLILAPTSLLQRSLSNTKPAERTALIYRAIFARTAQPDELAQIADLTAPSPKPEDDLIWALLNSPEFLFIH